MAPTLKQLPPDVDIEVREGLGANIRVSLRRAGVATPEFADSVFTVTAPLGVDAADAANGNVFLLIPPEAIAGKKVLHWELRETPVLDREILIGRVLVQQRDVL